MPQARFPLGCMPMACCPLPHRLVDEDEDDQRYSRIIYDATYLWHSTACPYPSLGQKDSTFRPLGSLASRKHSVDGVVAGVNHLAILAQY